MDRITKLTVEDVRCFEGINEVDIRPLTFLVGENSTGKSTILGCIQAFCDSTSFGPHRRPAINFNSEPYQMGSFADIVRRSNSNIENFELGMKIERQWKDQDSEIVDLSLNFKEGQRGAEPKIKAMNLISNSVEVSISRGEQDVSMDMDAPISSAFSVNYDSENSKFQIIVAKNYSENITPEIYNSIYFIIQEADEGSDEFELKKFIEKVDTEKSKGKRRSFLMGRYFDIELNAISFGPIRSNPERTFSPQNTFDEKRHDNVPIDLRNLEYNTPEKFNNLKQKIAKFGDLSGMFSNMKIRNFTESKNDPFQLEFEIRGEFYNFRDVGYGISQILPIIEGIENQPWRATCFLMQQPEVHLHPQAQAALTSFIVSEIKRTSPTYIIETHSDYMIDRARIEINRGNIDAKDVAVVYLEPTRNSVKIHNVSFDKMGNLQNVPDGYRSFFINEADSLFGFEV